jgi:hypothetical protein
MLPVVEELSGSSSRAESSGSVAGRAARKPPAVSKRVLSSAALPSRSDVNREPRSESDGLSDTDTDCRGGLADAAARSSSRLHRMHARHLTLEQMLKRNWFVRTKSHDPRYWSYSVLRIAAESPLAKLAADTTANKRRIARNWSHLRLPSRLLQATVGSGRQMKAACSLSRTLNRSRMLSVRALIFAAASEHIPSPL